VVGSTPSRCSYWKALRMNSIRSHVLHVTSRLRNSSLANTGRRRTSIRACRQGTVDPAGRRMERPPCNGNGRSIAEVSHVRWSASDFGGSRQINPTQFLAVSSNTAVQVDDELNRARHSFRFGGATGSGRDPFEPMTNTALGQPTKRQWTTSNDACWAAM
jgi:hypothetical protein